MKFSICIPNYNYAQYIGETIESVRLQGADFEIIVADNCSTDESCKVVEDFADPRIILHRNSWNVGFAGNLDKACNGATGDRMILLSSDDLALPKALGTYDRLAVALGAAHEDIVFGSSQQLIDGASAITGEMGFTPRLWQGAKKDEALSELIGAPVWRIPADKLLHNSLRDMRVPFAFATTCYSRKLYKSVEGYGGSRLINPDKHFAWKLLTRATEAIHVDLPLFAYRVHDANQTAQQAKAGALKHIVDQYIASFDTPLETLDSGHMASGDMAAAFIEHDIALRGLKMLAEGNRCDARRGVHFAKAAYPAQLRSNAKAWVLRGLLLVGPIGTLIGKNLFDRAHQRFVSGD